MTLAPANSKFLRLRDILRRSGSTVTGKRDHSHAVARGCGTMCAHMRVHIHLCARMYMCLRGMELCNGYRFWTLESRLMNTKHVNSRGKSVEWAPSFSFGRCLRSIEEADVEARGVSDHLPERPLCTNPLLLIVVRYSWPVSCKNVRTLRIFLLF